MYVRALAHRGERRKATGKTIHPRSHSTQIPMFPPQNINNNLPAQVEIPLTFSLWGLDFPVRPAGYPVPIDIRSPPLMIPRSKNRRPGTSAVPAPVFPQRSNPAAPRNRFAVMQDPVEQRDTWKRERREEKGFETASAAEPFASPVVFLLSFLLWIVGD